MPRAPEMLGMERGASHGLVLRSLVCLSTALFLVTGSNFHRLKVSLAADLPTGSRLGSTSGSPGSWRVEGRRTRRRPAPLLFPSASLFPAGGASSSDGTSSVSPPPPSVPQIQVPLSS